MSSSSKSSIEDTAKCTGGVANAILSIWPIQNNELKKFIPMAFMALCVLFVFSFLRSTKDALLVANVGAEAISFVKVYCIVPVSILVMIAYAKMTNVMTQHKIFYSFCLLFLGVYLLFCFVLYPNQELIHPSAESINALTQSSFSVLGLFTVDMSHFKWFLKCYGKWSYVLFYVFSELWISLMFSLLFWQFANSITKTTEAKRFYPMIGLCANIGLIVGGLILGALTKQDGGGNKLKLDAESTDRLIYAIGFIVGLAVLALMATYRYMVHHVLTDPRFAAPTTAKKKEKVELSLSEGFKIVFSSKYLGFIAIMVVCYAISINLIEGPWKDAAKKLYPDTNSYMRFMGTLQFWTGSITMIAYFLSAQLLKRAPWIAAAMVAPLMMSISGVCFFVFLMMDKSAGSNMAGIFGELLTPLQLAVTAGLIQNVATKSTKYSFFDPTREMTYIPAGVEIQTKGKAAVDMLGHRAGKSVGGILQSTIFMLFPAMGFLQLAPYFMAIFIVLSLIWLVDIKMLSEEYKELVSHKH